MTLNSPVEKVRALNAVVTQQERRTILIVDDSMLVVSKILELLSEVLESATAYHAASYEDAISLVHDTKPWVVLLDINLPGRNGIELLQYIKRYWPATIVIMVTNQSVQYYSELCVKLGADFFIDKSKDFDQIASIISLL